MLVDFSFDFGNCILWLVVGDFAVLISSGFSVKSAVAANFLSACSAYLGLIVGLIIGEVSSGALFVFAITAGFFLYISLSDMVCADLCLCFSTLNF